VVKIRVIKAIFLRVDFRLVKVSLFGFFLMDFKTIILIFDWVILFHYFKIVIVIVIVIAIAIAIALELIE
jgi:hypothetical protein